MLQFPNVTVIIPFYGKSELLLLECLRAIACQTYSRDKIEVVVVDNNEIPVLKTKLKSNYEITEITILHENKYGSYAARNKGIEFAKGDILAFTDSDCIPNCDWLKNAIKGMQTHNFKCAIGGNIVFTYKIFNKPNLFEFYDSTMHLRQEFYVTNCGYAATANLILPKYIFNEQGKFNTTFYSGGDKEWGERATKNGLKLIFDKDVIVVHPARATAFSIIKKNIRTVGGEFVRIKNNGFNSISLLAIEKKAIKARRNTIANGIRFSNNTLHLKIVPFFYFIQSIRLLEALRLILGGVPQRQ